MRRGSSYLILQLHPIFTQLAAESGSTIHCAISVWSLVARLGTSPSAFAIAVATAVWSLVVVFVQRVDKIGVEFFKSFVDPLSKCDWRSRRKLLQLFFLDCSGIDEYEGIPMEKPAPR